jgi:hypothetical protein
LNNLTINFQKKTKTKTRLVISKRAKVILFNLCNTKHHVIALIYPSKTKKKINIIKMKIKKTLYFLSSNYVKLRMNRSLWKLNILFIFLRAHTTRNIKLKCFLLLLLLLFYLACCVTALFIRTIRI